MNMVGIYIDSLDRVNHRTPHLLMDAELINICALSSLPLPAALVSELQKRGLVREFMQVIEQGQGIPDN